VYVGTGDVPTSCFPFLLQIVTKNASKHHRGLNCVGEFNACKSQGIDAHIDQQKLTKATKKYSLLTPLEFASWPFSAFSASLCSTVNLKLNITTSTTSMGDNMESNLSHGAQAVAQARANADFSDEDSITESMHDTTVLSKGSGEEQEPTDALTRLRRQKRLAMNRESARARRKRKKCLIETLEEHVAELTQKNRRYQIATETLTSKVNKLESDLTLARSTITYLSGQNQPRSNMLSHRSPTELGLSGVSASASASASSPSRQSEFQNRFLQAQALSNSQLSAGSAYGQSAFIDDHRLRQHALDMQIAQASRDGTLESVLGRYAASQQQDLGFNSYGASASGLQRNSSNNTVRVTEP
jgi:hypothetical protein